jgi:hypothetical protein
LKALFAIFFLWTRYRQGKKVFSPPLQRLSLSLSLSLSHFPKKPGTMHTPSWPTTMMKGAKETSLAGGYPVATQPPYSFDVTGQG